MNVTVVGGGYVGLATASSLAWVGHEICVVEVNQEKLARLQAGLPPFFEPHLDGVLTACRGQMHFTASHADALADADVAFLAVGTPPDENGAPDLSQMDAAFGQVLETMPSRSQALILVTKSTVPIGFGDEMTKRLRRAGLEDRVVMASNPEFLRQGRALHDSLYPDRIVIGGPERALTVLRRVYRPIALQAFDAPPGLPRPSDGEVVPVLEVDRRSAELAKYAANAFLAMRISFINEIANVCDRLGGDIDDVARVIGADSRIGQQFLRAGVGYGGSCFPKDTRALRHIASASGYDFALMDAVIRVNDKQRLRVLERLEERLGDLAGKRIALLGLAFKPGTDDMREAPSITLTQALLKRGAEVRGHDPVALDNARRLLPAATSLHPNVADALAGADAAVLLAEWPEYLDLDPDVYREAMRRPLIIDGRNALPDKVRRELEYCGIGRGALPATAEERRALAAD